MSNLFSPNKFLSQLNANRGTAKNSLYKVDILPPQILVTGPSSITASNFSEQLSMLCEAAEMPGKALTSENVVIYGPGYNVPYLTTYQNIALTFYCTNIHTERLLFDLWMDSIVNPVTNNARFAKGINSSYMTGIDITQYDTNADKEIEIYKVKLNDAFPISIAPQQLAWNDDGFQRLSVSFLYQTYSRMPLVN